MTLARRIAPVRSAPLPTELRGWADRVADGGLYSPPLRSRVRQRRLVVHARAGRFTLVLWAAAIPILKEDWTVHAFTAGQIYDVIARFRPLELRVVRMHWIHRQVVRALVVCQDEAGNECVCGHLYARATFTGLQE